MNAALSPMPGVPAETPAWMATFMATLRRGSKPSLVFSSDSTDASTSLGRLLALDDRQRLDVRSYAPMVVQDPLAAEYLVSLATQSSDASDRLPLSVAEAVPPLARRPPMRHCSPIGCLLPSGFPSARPARQDCLSSRACAWRPLLGTWRTARVFLTKR